jgi:hypothetical protein
MSKRLKGGGGPEIHAEYDGGTFHMIPGAPAEVENLVQVSLSTLEKEFAKSELPCWFCDHFMKPDDAQSNPAMAKLWDVFFRGHGKLHDDKLAAQLYKCYKAVIYDPVQAQRKTELETTGECETSDVPLCDEKTVKRHLVRHMTLPKVRHKRRVQNALALEETLATMLFERAADGGADMPVRENIKLFFEAQKATTALLTLNPERFVEL